MKEKNIFCNPVSFADGKRHTNPDPFILRWCGKYFCYATDEFGVKISESENLTDWTRRGYAIKEEAYRNYWAPAVIYRNGIFYMYYSNVPAGSEDCHEECLKLATAERPEGPFVWEKTFFDKFSIDAHPILWNGKMYLFYSVNDWIGTDEKIAGTCILADELVTPEELSGNPKEVVLPGIRQEIYEENRFGDGRDWYTIEGAAPVVRGSYFWVLYSANAYVNEDYFVGFAAAERKCDFTDMRWEKFPSEKRWHPLLKKNGMVEGTGHNTVELAPDLMDEWIIYHGRRADEEIRPETEQREMYIEPLYFNGRQIVCFGPSTQAQDAPGKPDICRKDLAVRETCVLAESGDFYVAELWLSAENGHAGMRYGIILDGSIDGDYLEIQIHSGRNELKAVECIGGIRVCLLTQKLEKGYRHTVPHLIRVEKKFSSYRIQVAGGPAIFLESAAAGDGGQTIFPESAGAMGAGQERAVGIVPYFTCVNLHSFALTRGLILEGMELRHLGKLYDVSFVEADESGLSGVGETFTLERRCMSGGCSGVSCGESGEGFREEACRESGEGFREKACRESNDGFWKELRGEFQEEFQFEALGEDDCVTFAWDGPAGQTIEITHDYPSYSVYYICQGGSARLLADGKIIRLQEGVGRGGRLNIHLKNSRITSYRLKQG